MDPLNCIILAMSLIFSMSHGIHEEKSAFSHVPLAKQCLVARSPGAASGRRKKSLLKTPFFLEKLYNMSSATYFFPATFLNFFAELVFLLNIRGAVIRYSKRDQQ